MAKIHSFSQEMVLGLYGEIDFYYWKGIPVARRWPRLSTVPPSPRLLASRNAFKACRADLREVPESVRVYWRAAAQGSNQPWLDYYTGIYLRTWKEIGAYPPVITEVVYSEE